MQGRILYAIDVLYKFFGIIHTIKGHLPHPYQPDPIDVNVLNVVAQWFVCSRTSKPNVRDCGHCGRDARVHHGLAEVGQPVKTQSV